MFNPRISNIGLVPAVAIKFFRDDFHSGNILFMGKKTGQTEPDVFRYAMATHATERTSFALKAGINHFKNFSVYPTKTGLSDFATPVGGEYAVTSIRKQYEQAQYIKQRVVDSNEIGRKRSLVKHEK